MGPQKGGDGAGGARVARVARVLLQSGKCTYCCRGSVWITPYTTLHRYLPTYTHHSTAMNTRKTMYVGAAECACLLACWLINPATVLPCVDVPGMVPMAWNFKAFMLLRQ